MQHLKEYDPEWAQAWTTDTANGGVDHATMLAQEKTPVLLTHHFHMTAPDTGQLMGAMPDIQAAQARRLLESTGQPVTFTPLDAPHACTSRWHSSTSASSPTGSRTCPDLRTADPDLGRCRALRPRPARTTHHSIEQCASRALSKL
ncbi:hypothetical protein [Streptomyces flavofungini]|uniref:Uncharacterized protein n=1 Tax=Streptomyces flavofungini TaxID=68200 RepID=A0ABS0X4U4_9ACTN|nr:hypothetical protein [Streptomyces flavofungini]MBJ3808188.1 hypothetical protein [Streptomyces flavofungini]